MEIRFLGHGAYRTEYHIVWIPKYRRRILNPGVQGYLRKLFPKVVRSLPGCEIVECAMARDHVHMVMIIPPGYALRDVVGKVKGRTASRLRKKISWLERVYWRENVVWAPGYFVHSFQDLVSLNEQNKRNSWQPEKKSHNADALPIFLKFQGSK